MLNINNIGFVRTLVNQAELLSSKVSPQRADRRAKQEEIFTATAVKVVNAILNGKITFRPGTIFNGGVLQVLPTSDLPREISQVEAEVFVYKPYLGQMFRTMNGPLIYIGYGRLVDPSRVYIQNKDGSIRLGFPVGNADDGEFVEVFDTSAGQIFVYLKD